MQEERRSETLAAERVEAESRATATLQSRIALEEALTRKALEAAHAARRAAESKHERAESEEELKLARRTRALAERAPRRIVPALLASAFFAAAAIGALAWFQSPEPAVAAAQEPLKLRLETRLSSYKP